MLGHFGWNVEPDSDGLQLLLFNRDIRFRRPGYEPFQGESGRLCAGVLARVRSILGGALAVAGDWTILVANWLRPRVWGWLLFAGS